jgi:hypothetical protein
MHLATKTLLAVVAVSSTLGTTGCFFELNGALLGVSGKGPNGEESTDKLKSGYGIGINFGVAYDHEKKVRGALFGGLDGVLAKTESGQSVSSTANGIGGRVDYSVADLGSDDTKLRITGGLLYGLSKSVKVEQAKTDSSSFVDVHGGATIAFFGGEASSVMLTLGPKYVKSSGDYGSMSAFGVHASVTYTWTPFNNDGGGGGGCPENIDGMCAFKSELPDDTNVIPALVVGALGAGCKAGMDGQKMVAKCPGGNVLAAQQGRVVIRACEEGLPGSTCRAIWTDILNHVPHD